MSYVSARSLFRLACGMVATALLAGCAWMAAPQRPAVPDAGFALEGRVAVRYGSENLSGRIAWTHERSDRGLPGQADDKTRDDIGLASPLGNQLARLLRDATGVTLTDSNQQIFRAADAESLTEQRLGWRLPLAGLADWVRGRASGGVAAEVQRDAAGRIGMLAQSDWRIEYSYEDDLARLPKRLIMQYLKAAEPLEIRLVIERWL